MFATMVDHLQREGLSRKKWPEHLLIVEEMAIGATGKLDKKTIAAHAASALGRS
jgi:acyl-CoA synthetase